MRAQCRRQLYTYTVCALAWSTSIGLVIHAPVPTSPLRLLFFCALGLAVSSTTLSVFPWVIQGFIRDSTLAYVAGYMHSQADAPPERPALELVR